MSRLFQTNLPLVVLLASSILWGLNWLPLKALNARGLEGIPLLFVSHLWLSGIFLWLAKSQFSFAKKHLKALLAIACFGGGAIFSFTYALVYGDVIRVMVLFYLLPVWGVIGGVLFLNEASSWGRWFGVLLAVVGAFLILGGSKIFDRPPSAIDALALVSGLFFAVNNLFFRGVESVPLSIKILFMVLGCTVFSALLILLGVQKIPQFLPVTTWGWAWVYAGSWLFFANLGSLWAVSKMEAGRSSIILIVELIAAVISALIIAGERLAFWEWVGCAAIACATLMEALRPKS